MTRKSAHDAQTRGVSWEFSHIFDFKVGSPTLLCHIDSRKIDTVRLVWNYSSNRCHFQKQQSLTGPTGKTTRQKPVPRAQRHETAVKLSPTYPRNVTRDNGQMTQLTTGSIQAERKRTNGRPCDSLNGTGSERSNVWTVSYDCLSSSSCPIVVFIPLSKKKIPLSKKKIPSSKKNSFVVLKTEFPK